jgi:hypothetical protein
VLILLENSHNPHLCVGSGGDQLEIPDDSILFAEIEASLFTGRKYAFGWGEEMHHFFTEGIVCLLIVGGFRSVRLSRRYCRIRILWTSTSSSLPR